MTSFDRYVLRQLLWMFGFFSLVLVLVYWVNRAVSLFDQLIADGQSAAVFLEFTALSLPNVIRVVLPVSAFAASLYVVNRLSAESELVAMQATGYGPFRLARPVFIFGLIAAAFVTVLVHLLVPASLRTLGERQDEIAENVTAGLLREGEFLHPSPDFTLYIREIGVGGDLQDVFLSDSRSEGVRTTFTARRAYLVRTDQGPALVMYEGIAQRLTAEDRRLAVTRFDEFAYDIAQLLGSPEPGPRRPNALWTAELFRAGPEALAGAGGNPARLLQEGHGRIAQAFRTLAVPVFGFAVLISAGFSRFGIWRQIVLATLGVIAFDALNSALVDSVRADAALWPLAYLAPGLLLLVAGGLLLRAAGRPVRPARSVPA